jgi:hypothetical protein
MRVVPINEAEAIIEPFWDGGSSEHPTDKYSLLEQYRLLIPPSVRGRIVQTWCSVDVHLDKAAPGEVVAMERECDLPLGDYDVLRVFAALPRWMTMTVRACIDGVERIVLDHVPGVDTTDEFDGPFLGSRLTWLRLEFALTEPRPGVARLEWLGLANKAAQARMEARPSPYTPDWPGALAEVAETLQPQIGIFFSAQELEALRRKLSAGPLHQAYLALRKQAEQDLQLNPEQEIGYLIPRPDRRWCRNRDMKRTCTAGIMERLAFVGLVEGNLEMSRMAARMALSAAHCDTWCESIMGVFPGATWHHRSFTEEIYCRACALVLDWAGACLTPHGRQIIRDAIIMKGLPRIESDFKRMEYIRHMNQGIVFSSGRIIGLLGLLPAYPRYVSVLEEAERDLHEMIDSYVHEDGGTLEGMGYWNYTFSTAMPLFYALARHHGQSLKEYATPTLLKTGDYALAMLSTKGDGLTYLPINDAHADQYLAPSLVAAYAQLSANPAWADLYAAMMEKVELRPDLYHFILAPETVKPGAPVVRPKFAVLPVVGQVSSVRHDPALGYVHFHLCSGPTYGGHYHEDKGSFILEAGGEVLACDRGVTSYDHPEVALIGMAARHNLVYPESPEGVLMRQPGNAPGGLLTSALEHEGAILLASDNLGAWAPGLFRKNLRRVFSPTPDLYLLDDELALEQPWVVSFRLNSTYPMEARDGAYWVRGERAALRVVPLNWVPSEATWDVEGVDCHLHPTHLLRLATAPAASHRLLTAIQVVPGDAPEDVLWSLLGEEGILLARRGEMQVRSRVGAAPSWQVEVHRAGREILRATAEGGAWRLG